MIQPDARLTAEPPVRSELLRPTHSSGQFLSFVPAGRAAARCPELLLTNVRCAPSLNGLRNNGPAMFKVDGEARAYGSLRLHDSPTSFGLPRYFRPVAKRKLPSLL